MKKAIKDLQEQYKKGEIKKSQYLAKLAKLVEDEEITQEEADDAEDFNPDADKPIYTQDDVDSMIKRRTTQEIRKMLKDAGVEVDASNKDLAAKVIELVKVGAGKMKAPESTDPEAVKAATQAATRIATLTADLKTVRMENAALKVASKYNPVSQAAVIAMLKSDYAHEIDYLDEDTGEVDIKSIDKVMRKMQLNDPDLFRSEEGKQTQQQQQGAGFRGKGPGGNGGSAGEDSKHSAKLAEAKAMMGIKEATTK